MLDQETERVASIVVDAAFKVHSSLGPGLLESVYETCLALELTKRNLRIVRQVPQRIIYDGQIIDAELRLDLVVEDCIIIEVKSVEKHNPLFEAQLLTYLKLSGRRLGFLINFNVRFIKEGIKRIVL